MGKSCISLASLDGFEYDSVEAETLVARKPHKCCECGVAINQGEHYVHEKCFAEGESDTYITCLDCHDFRSRMVCEFFYGLMWEGFSEVVEYMAEEEFPWDAIAELRSRAREMALEIIQKEFDRWGYGV